MVGPNPNFASIWTQLGDSLELPDTALAWASSLQTIEDGIITGRDGYYTPEAARLYRRAYPNLAGVISGSFARSLIAPHLREFVRLFDNPEFVDADPTRLLFLLAEYMVDNSETINSRNMTFGTITAGGSNVGDGEIVRLTVDSLGSVLEGTSAEAKSAEVIADQNSGAQEHQETIRIEGAVVDPTGLNFTGSGFMGNLRVANARTSLVFNASFENNDATADDSTPGSLTAITGWTIASSTANYKLRTGDTYVYRGYPTAPSTLWGLEITGNDTISQVFASVSPGLSFGRRVPFLCQIKLKRRSDCDATVTLHLGTQSKALDLGTISNDVWTTLRIDLDENCYGLNFNKDGLDLKIVTSGRTTGSVVVDDVILEDMTLLNGHWYSAIGGATPFLYGDTWTWTDSEGGTRAVYSHWLWRAYGAGPRGPGIGFWLPTENTGSETVSDPSY